MSSESHRYVSDHGASTVPRQNWMAGQLHGCEVGSCAIERLLPVQLSPRAEGVVDEHVRLLVESAEPLPPIVVHRPTMRVVDGMHRLRAAALRGDSEIGVLWYSGDERDVFALAVHANVSHGLPLTHTDRRNAAARLVRSHPHWSDRMIASIVNLASSTVRGIRVGLTAQQPCVRVGLDGRIRPTSTAAGRQLAGQLLRSEPESSIRKIARTTGLAPSTVLDVRNRIEQGLDPVRDAHGRGKAAVAHTRPAAETDRDPDRDVRRGSDLRSVPDTGADGATADRGVEADLRVDADATDAPLRQRTGAGPLPADVAESLRNLRNDPSLRFSEAGRIVLRWLETVPADASRRADVIDRLPPHCLHAVAVLARCRAKAWQQFADQVGAKNVHMEHSE